MSDARPTIQRQFTSRSVDESADRRAMTSNGAAVPAFGRQGPEVRILSPRPIYFADAACDAFARHARRTGRRSRIARRSSAFASIQRAISDPVRPQPKHHPEAGSSWHRLVHGDWMSPVIHEPSFGESRV